MHENKLQFKVLISKKILKFQIGEQLKTLKYHLEWKRMKMIL